MISLISLASKGQGGLNRESIFLLEVLHSTNRASSLLFLPYTDISCRFKCYPFYGIVLKSVFAALRGGVVAQLVERTTPGEEALDSIPAVPARSLLFGLVSV